MLSCQRSDITSRDISFCLCFVWSWDSGIVRAPHFIKGTKVPVPFVSTPTATTGDILAGSTTALVNAGTADGGTMMYKAIDTNTQPTSTDGFSATIPTAEGCTAGTWYVWYYAKGNDTHSDSEISASAVEVTVKEVTLASAFEDGATLSFNVVFGGENYNGYLNFKNESGSFTFTGKSGGFVDKGGTLTKNGDNLVLTVTPTNDANNGYYTVTINTSTGAYSRDISNMTSYYQNYAQTGSDLGC